MSVKLEQLAQAAGVSPATASRVLSNSKHPVNEQTRQRILRLAKDLDYRPNLAARSLRTDRTRMIGIIVDNICTPFTPMAIRGIQDHLQDLGYSGVVINANWDPDSETEAIRDLVSRSIDGIIFVESRLRGPNPTLDLANKPYVFVHRLFNSSVPNSVAVDERYGARLAMQHLLDMGHRRIAYINGPRGWEASEERFQAYQEFLQEQGIPYRQEFVELGDWEIQGGNTATQNLLKLAERPTAIFAANDLMALGAIYAIQDAGLRVPDDIAVMGYDDREIASQARPSITTVTLPCYELGQASAHLLLQLLENQAGVEESIKIRGKLIVRESCGSADSKKSLDNFDPRTTARQPLYSRQSNNSPLP